MAEQETNLTPVDDLGEFGLIERIQQIIGSPPDTVIEGIGDDSAILMPPQGHALTSVDMYVEGIHFDLAYTPLMHLGYKCVSATVSDIYAMNGKPLYITVALSISSKITVQAIDELYKGMAVACENFGVALVGGDTTSAKTGLSICVSVIGEAEPGNICRRSGAGDNDLLVVTGDLGGAYMGLQILEREKRVFLEAPTAQPQLTGYDYILRRQLRPEARKDVIEQLGLLDIVPTSMIDISDGLASEALHLAKASGKGMRIYEEKIPMDDNTRDTALSLRIDPTLCALSGGEDYELLFTIRQEDFDKIKFLPDFTVIGHTTGEGGKYELISRAGVSHPLVAQGFRHF